MMKILLVENDPVWLDSVSRTLPDFEVDLASSHAEALARLASGVTYDVAVVDLNLIDSDGQNPQDLLGGLILLQLRRDHPATRRIALTGYPPGAIREQVFDRYEVDELLIKGTVTLAHLREVVQLAMDRTLAHLPPEVRAARSALWADYRAWRDDWQGELGRRRRVLRDEIQIAGTVGAGGTIDAGAALAALDSQRAAFGAECSRVEVMLVDIRDLEDVAAASSEIETAKLKFAFGEQAEEV
jgi:CheY-like chemotaxis protein